MLTACTATRHGTLYAYNRFACRCPTARAAKCRQEKARNLRKLTLGHGLLIPPHGTARRLRALCVIGWNTRDLAAALGASQYQTRRWIAGENWVHVDTATRVAAVYDRLNNTPGNRPRADRTRDWATSNGWLAPIWWDADTIDDPTTEPNTAAPTDVDPIVVERLCAGKTVPHTRAEKLAAVAHMHHTGATVTTTAKTLHSSNASITRDLERLGLNRQDAA
jgi:hypothetical protein